MKIFFKLVRESIISAFRELFNNKLRAFLSLLGITIGIFCIISVFTAVDSLESNIRNTFETLGENVIYIQKFPWDEDPRQSWWKYIRRPFADYDEFEFLRDKLNTADGVAIMLFVKGKIAKYRNNVVEDLDILAATHDYEKIRELKFAEGRYFSLLESQRGTNVAIIGGNVAAELFPGQDEIVGRTIKVLDRDVTVIGVLEKEGDDLIGFTFDNNILLSYNFAKQIIDVDGFFVEPWMAVKAKEGVSLEELKDEVRGLMRSVRKLKPKEEDNFAMNQLSIISGVLTRVFGIISVAGAAIGIFSILVGGFGIANIMFVSVRERTRLIGIKKALGAKRSFILLEFLIEAMVLCLIGGLMGLLFVVIESRILEVVIKKMADLEFSFIVTFKNSMIGLGLSVIIGLIAGLIPALVAAFMKPVDAIRS